MATTRTIRLTKDELREKIRLDTEKFLADGNEIEYLSREINNAEGLFNGFVISSKGERYEIKR